MFQNIVKAVFKWSKEIELKRERSVGKKFKRGDDQMTGRNLVREKGRAFKAESNKHSSREEVYRDTGDTNMGKKGINNKEYSTDQSLSSKPTNFKPSPTYCKWKESVLRRTKIDARLSIHNIKGIPPNMITDSEALKEAAIEMFRQYTSPV